MESDPPSDLQGHGDVLGDADPSQNALEGLKIKVVSLLDIAGSVLSLLPDSSAEEKISSLVQEYATTLHEISTMGNREIERIGDLRNPVGNISPEIWETKLIEDEVKLWGEYEQSLSSAGAGDSLDMEVDAASR